MSSSADIYNNSRLCGKQQSRLTNQPVRESRRGERTPLSTLDSLAAIGLSVHLQRELPLLSKASGPSARRVSADLQPMTQSQKSVDRFNRVLPNSVKSKSPHGKGMKINFTDFTYSLWREDMCRGFCASAIVPNLCLPVERIGKIGKIAFDHRAVMRFLFYRRQSNGGKTVVDSRVNGGVCVEVST